MEADDDAFLVDELAGVLRLDQIWHAKAHLLPAGILLRHFAVKVGLDKDTATLRISLLLLIFLLFPIGLTLVHEQIVLP